MANEKKPNDWFSIHIMAKNSIDDETENYFIKFFEIIINNYPCSICRSHAKEYYQLHPLSKWKGWMDKEGRRVGMFFWTWKFHNTVNARLGYPLMNYQTAWELYESIHSCDVVCGK